MNQADRLIDIVRKNQGIPLQELVTAMGVKNSGRIYTIAFYARQHGHKLTYTDGRYYLNGHTPPVKSKPQPKSEPAPVAAPVQAKVGDVLTDFIQNISNTLAEQIIMRVESHLVDRLSQLSARIPERVVPATKTKLKRVLVCGLLPAQAGLIQSEFHSCLDLRFLSVDDKIDKFKTHATHVDHVIVMTNFISHKHQEAIECVGVKPILVSGGMSSLKDKLTEIYAEAA